MFNNLIMVALFALGLYLLVTSVQAYMNGNTGAQNIVYIAIGVLLVVYNLRVVTKIFRS